jgi:DNA polymerase
MALKYPDLKKSRSEESGWDEWTYQAKEMRKKIYGGLLCENIVQALARIIVAQQMLTISKRAPVVMTTHDEVVACVLAALGAATYKFMHKCMSTPLAWCKDIPLNYEGGYATNYSK